MSQLKGNFVPVLSFSVFLVVNFHKHVHCSYEHPKPDELERGVHIEAPHLVKKRSIDQPLRISTIFDESIDGLEGEKYKLVYDKLLPEAISFWEKALKVRKPVRPMKLNRQCPTRQVFLREGKSYCVDKCNPVTICGEILVPDHHLNPCYVCNSKGDNCRELPEESLQETTSTTESNAISENATVIPGSEDEVEDSKGIEDDDFFLYITAEETQRCNSDIIAYAVHCQQESSLDRPIAGHANFCPSGLSTKSFDYSLQLSSVKHEILHALGFSDLLFDFYRDENGEPLTERLADTGYPPYDEKLRVHKWSDRVVKNITRKNWMVRGGSIERSFQMVVTPRVVKEVREHFNCSDLEGAELEDQGGEGTALTHWEKRIFENEAMSGTQTQTSVFSRITFAMMEDTGWYRADYSHAAPLDWGRGLGCKFAMTSCKQWLNTQSREKAKPFCEKIKKIPAETDCSSNRLGVVLCNLVRHDTELPKVYQHFDLLPHVASGEEAHYGGSVSLADYCPYLQEFDWKQSALTTRRSTCTDESNKPDPNNNFALEDFGPHSRCFKNSGRAWQQQSCETILKRGNTGSSCYKYKCHSGRLHIEIGNYTYPCYYAGQKLKIQIRNGKWLHKGGGIICPPCSELCAQEFALRNEYCKADEKEIPNNLYPNDALNCSGVIGTPTVMPSRGVAIVTPAITLIAAILCAV